MEDQKSNGPQEPQSQGTGEFTSPDQVLNPGDSIENHKPPEENQSASGQEQDQSGEAQGVQTGSETHEGSGIHSGGQAPEGIHYSGQEGSAQQSSEQTEDPTPEGSPTANQTPNESSESSKPEDQTQQDHKEAPENSGANQEQASNPEEQQGNPNEPIIGLRTGNQPSTPDQGSSEQTGTNEPIIGQQEGQDQGNEANQQEDQYPAENKDPNFKQIIGSHPGNQGPEGTETQQSETQASASNQPYQNGEPVIGQTEGNPLPQQDPTFEESAAQQQNVVNNKNLNPDKKKQGYGLKGKIMAGLAALGIGLGAGHAADEVSGGRTNTGVDDVAGAAQNIGEGIYNSGVFDTKESEAPWDGQPNNGTSQDNQKSTQNLQENQNK